jgi:hypothetical protein
MPLPTLDKLLEIVPVGLRPVASEGMAVLLRWAAQDLQRVQDWVILAQSNYRAALIELLAGMTDEESDRFKAADLRQQEADAVENAERLIEQRRLLINALIAVGGMILGAL